MIRLRDYQNEAVQSIFDYYASGQTGNPVVALPTGTGKSVVIAEFCRRVLSTWPNQKIIVATHVKELIEQNAKAMLRAWNTAPVGIYSAGLGLKESMQSIIFGGIQSMVNAVPSFGLRHLMLVDEAHLVSPKVGSRYQKVIKEFQLMNPNFKVIGFTATAWRTGSGSLADSTDGGIFTDVCCDMTSLDRFNWFIDQGYLCSLIPKQTRTELDVSSVGITNGDYAQNELQAAVDKNDITYNICREVCEQAYDRRSWLVFAAGVEHAEHVAECMRMLGISAYAVHEKTKDRDEIITSFKNGAIRCVVNNNVLTTGFDYPALDCIAMLRPTTSSGLWVQMLGRGTRPLNGKRNCLVLDFAGNTRRLGPINDPVIPKKRGKSGAPGVAPIKICPVCGVYNHASATECAGCSIQFERQSKLVVAASTEELIRTGQQPNIVEMEVQRVIYSKQPLSGRPPAMKVSYFCGLNHAKEVLFFEHTGFARTKARQWWRQRSATEPPDDIDSALKQTQFLREPKRIKVHTNKKPHPEITEYIW
jgi:DNA repair protein RadD